MKTRYLLLAVLLAPALLFAQSDLDAFRFSQSSITGTARYSSMSGAFGALGGDFSCLASNPAGIAIYRRSEISFTPSIFDGKTSSEFIGKSADDNRFNFNFGNAGMVYTGKLTQNDEGPGWKSWNFGFGYNRINNFNNRKFYEAVNPTSSLTGYFAQQAQGLSYDNLDPYYEYLAYYTYLINPDSLNNYTAAAPEGKMLQRRSLETKGSMGEMDFSFGGNYGNKLYIGASLGFASLKYISSSDYEEIDKDNVIDTLKQYRFTEDLTTRGNGINFKVGLIYRANDYVRLGAAIHTPTWYTMHDEYINTMFARFDGGHTETKDSPAGTYDYELTTPFKAIGSAAFLFEKYGLLSIDYEFSDPSQARFYASGSSYADVNDAVRIKYTATGTLRVGTEWMIGNYSIRGGYSHTSSPIASIYRVNGSDFSKTSYSGGLGIRDNNTFIDLGYILSIGNEYYQPYILNAMQVPGVKEKVLTHNFTLTFGVKF